MGFKKHAHDSERLDCVFDALAHKYRRKVLVAVLEQHPQADDDIQIPADVPLEGEDMAACEVAMTHNHLPKLADHGFIDWDRDSNTVRKGPHFEEIRPLLELMCDHADEWL
jgi:hypothetical protein